MGLSVGSLVAMFINVLAIMIMIYAIKKAFMATGNPILQEVATNS